MDSKSKTMFTRLKKEDDYFYEKIQKLTIGNQLNSDELSYLLSLSLLFFDEYNNSKNKGFFEFSYYLVLSYSIYSGDMAPLLDFSVNNGFYPIAKCIFENYESSIFTSVLENGISQYKNGEIIQLKEQKEKLEKVLSSQEKYRAYVAPTSYGKSSFIQSDISNGLNDKIAIIVPKKALIWQVYKNMKVIAKNLGYKILLHDTEYLGETKFIGIFTQERAIRLIQENNVFFDVLYIDEAHNLYEKDDRNLLLARLINLNKRLNTNQKVIYLSPLINDANNLMLDDTIIDMQKIEFNIREVSIKYFDLEHNSFYYNRFIDEYYLSYEQYNDWRDYILKQSQNKNLIYFYRPKDIELFSLEMIKYMPDQKDPELNELADLISFYIDKDYFMVDLIKRGIVYVHGKIPDLIKDFLLHKFNSIENLKYLVSNTSVLEGVNFPIDNLFIMNVRKLTENSLINLCGRVNRLNEVFTNPPKLNKLFCPIHFISTSEYGNNQNFKNKIKLLRCNEKDEVNNPLLINTNMNPVQRDKIRELETEYLDNFSNLSIKVILLKNNINLFYNNFDEVFPIIAKRINDYQPNENIDIISCIVSLYIEGFSKDDISDFELLRLKEPETQNFYNNYLKGIYYSDIRNKIKYFMNYFNYKAEKNELFYVGESFGEVEHTSIYYSGTRKTYIDLRKKSNKQKINLSIVKSKLEDDFISYKIAKLVKSLLDLQLISDETYNVFLYNTCDDKKISLLKSGMTFQIINFIEENDLMDHIIVSNFGITVSEYFLSVLNEKDDFVKYEIQKIL